MEPKKSQGPGLAKIAGSAVLVCLVLVGAAYLFKDRSQPTSGEEGSLATSRLQWILSRCEEAPAVDLVDGRERLRCGNKSHPAFIIEVTGTGEDVYSAGMMVPMRGSVAKLDDRIQLGLEMFGIVAGTQAEVFLPSDYIDAIGTRETSFAFEGRSYVTQPVANVGLLFLVRPGAGDAGVEN
jgi:hypothetical protein